MATNKVSITNIGTCRIAEPLAAAKRSKLIKRAIENIYGFIHTTKEALQQIDFCEGKTLPAELAPYISAKGSFPAWKKEPPSDLYFVEISSTKEIHFGEHLLQLNYLDTAFADRPALTKTFFRLYRELDKDKRAAELAQIPEFAKASPLEIRILLEGHVHQTSFEELREDMAEIVRRLPGEVVFFNHINVVGNDGAPIASRTRLCEWLQRIAGEDGYTLYDPSPLVLAYGRERALEDGGRDVNHYTMPFKEHYGKALVQQFCEGRNRSRPAAMVRAAKEVISAIAGTPAAGTPAAGTPDAEAPAIPAVVPDISLKQPLNKVAISAMIAKISGLLKTGELAQALPLAEELATLPEHSYKTTSVIAKVMLKERRLEEAALWLERALPLAPDATVPLYELVKCYSKLKDHRKVIATVDRIFEIEGENSELLILRRDAALRLADYPAAAATAMALTGIDADAAFAVAPTLASHGEYIAAAGLVAACRAEKLAAAEDPALHAKLVKGLAKTARQSMETGDAAAAAACWRAILLLEPGQEQALSRLGRLVAIECATAKERLQVPDMEGAMAAFRQALTYNPDDVRALRGLVRCLDQQQLAAESAAIWERLGALQFETEFSYRRAARFAARAGDIAKALFLYGKFDPAELDAETRTSIGSLVRKAAKAMRQAHDAGDFQGVSREGKAVLEVEPLHPATLQLLRSVQVDMSRRSVAETPSAERLFARRMVSDIHVILREAEQRALRWNIVPDTTSQAA